MSTFLVHLMSVVINQKNQSNTGGYCSKVIVQSEISLLTYEDQIIVLLLVIGRYNKTANAATSV